MKKFKELLFLFVPLIVFTILPIVIFIVSKTENASFKLFLKDGMFWNAVVNIYCKAIVFSALAVICIALLCHLIKSRKVFYLVSTISASVVSFFSVYTLRTDYFGLPMDVYNPQSLVSDSPPPVSFSVYDLLLAFQIGFLITFLFWLLELLVLFIKNKIEKHM